jgi:hypothetical protein
VPVLVFLNNHFAGYAPKTVQQLQQGLAANGKSGNRGKGEAGDSAKSATESRGAISRHFFN